MESAVAARPKSVVEPLRLSHGTLACRDLAKSRRFYEEFLGLEVVRHAKPAMMLRLSTGLYVVCVCIGEKVPDMHLMTHWGLNVASRAEVDRIHAAALAQKDEWGIQRVKNVRDFHGAYGFYLQDRDNNWWEVQYEPRTIEDFFAGGDKFGTDVHAVDTDLGD
jgi:catechol 2,3-dioxygenase-like lactoylglutathione lyase family enzyme